MGAGLSCQIRACGSIFLGHCGVLLCRLIHGIDRNIDFFETDRLLAGGFGKRSDIGVDISDLFDDQFQRPPGLANEFDAVSDELA